MTRLGRSTWWAVAAAAVAGLLLSLFVATGATTRRRSCRSAATPPSPPRTGHLAGRGGRGAPSAGRLARHRRTRRRLARRAHSASYPPTHPRAGAGPWAGRRRPSGRRGRGATVASACRPAGARVVPVRGRPRGPGVRGARGARGLAPVRRGPLADLQAISVGDRVEVATGPDGTGSTGSTASRGSTGRRCRRRCSLAPVPSGSDSSPARARTSRRPAATSRTWWSPPYRCERGAV